MLLVIKRNYIMISFIDKLTDSHSAKINRINILLRVQSIYWC